MMSMAGSAGSAALPAGQLARARLATAKYANSLGAAKADGYSLEARVWPPLRPMADVEALRLAAADGTLDAVASDHVRPHPLDREHPFEQAATGRAALRTAFADVIAAGLNPARAVALFTLGPAAVLGLPAPALTVGQGADLAVFDPAAARMRYTVLRGAWR